MNTRGQDAEERAATFLQTLGFRILARNFATRGGELDIVAWEGKILCFIEVRSRRSTAYGWPQETVTPSKQKRIICAAHIFLQARFHGQVPACRFDVVYLLGQDVPQLIRHAFELQ